MSVTLVLLPIALAAAAAAGGVGAIGAATMAKSDTSSAPAPSLRVRTRMKDSTLLARALTNLGASDITVSATRVTAEVDGVLLTMTLTDDDVWEAHVESTDGHTVTEATAADLLQRLDGEYAAMVQQAVAEKIRSRADSSGFDLVSETREADDTVTMVLNVRAEA
ncbi:hypothetical protein D9V29_03760 [Mycetocola manganoxydans]|uniref:DUF1257 domain-containing protein n=1 Tax=Mycetocola manganoxydans TaxID=699879 RepID=A0A3L6ZYW6_9MICO|nr:hypothetical protein [Mycetocola manganoxydans]RLP73129.1 hypothetical protein D9V29_03760 [Mycetocola manganoxydans]GHD43992.1 hypothetical protein GCM10008097_11380 [Mycetocola manganoxydans]